MEEIEYLEEYEDYILPSNTNCIERLSTVRKSADSLEGLYKDLIGDSCSAPEKTNTSQSSIKPNTNTDKSTLPNMVSVGLLSKSSPVPKCSTNYASADINTAESPHQLYKYQTSNISFNNRATNKSFSTCPVLQRTNKLKSVATVKPTLQRVNNPARQCIQNISPPLKITTMGQSYHATSLLSPSNTKSVIESREATNVHKNMQNKNNIKVSNKSQGSGMDPLSLDEAFLDFDVDKNGSVDEFDFESDLDNSITGGISDMDSDSVDLSDDYSDGNFDLESDLSSEGSNAKRGVLFKRKRLHESRMEKNSGKLKNKPGAISKLERQRDQTNLIRNKPSQPFKVGADQKNIARKFISTGKKPNHPSFEQRKVHGAVRKSQLVGRKESLMRPFSSKSKQKLYNDKLSKLSHQLLKIPNNSIDKKSNVVLNSKKTAVAPYCTKMIASKKENECARNATLKANAPLMKTEIRENDEKPAITEKVKTNNEIIKTIRTYTDDTVKKVLPDSSLCNSVTSLLKSEQSNSKLVVTPEKPEPIKFGSLYLKSIKPPINKGLMVNKTPEKNVSVAQQQPEQQKSPETFEVVRKHLESRQTEDISRKTVPESKVSVHCNDSNPSLHDTNVIDKNTSLQKSPATNTDVLSGRKSKEVLESEASEKYKKLNEDKNVSNNFETQLKNGVLEKDSSSIQKELKGNIQISPNTNCSLDKGLENTVEEDSSLTQDVPQTRSKENTVEKEKLSALEDTFKNSFLKIRLSKNEVAQYIRSSINDMKPKEQDSKNTLKRKIPSTIDTFTAETPSENVQDIINKSQNNLSVCESQEIVKKPKLDSVTPPKELEKVTETEKKDTENKPGPKIGKRRKTKVNGSPKILRSSNVKSLPQIPDAKNDETSDQITVNKPSLEVKDGDVHKTSKILASNHQTPANKPNLKAEEGDIPKSSRVLADDQQTADNNHSLKATEGDIQKSPRVLAGDQQTAGNNPSLKTAEGDIQKSTRVLTNHQAIVNKLSLKVTEENIQKSPRVLANEHENIANSLEVNEGDIQTSPMVSAYDHEIAVSKLSLKVLEGNVQKSPKVSTIEHENTGNKPTLENIQKSPMGLPNDHQSSLEVTEGNFQKSPGLLANAASTEVKKKRRPASRKNGKIIASENACSNNQSEDTDQTSIQTALTDSSCIPNESIVPLISTPHTEPNKTSETSGIEIIQPKKELVSESVIFQCHPGSMRATNLFPRTYERSRRNNQLLLDSATTTVKSSSSTNNSDHQNGTEFAVFELPSYIVMKTKIITRRDLQCSSVQIPSAVKHKIDKLAEERQTIPLLKMERPEFKDVCSDINSLLGQNANYLKFASVSERLTRMNQVLADASLSVEDAQSALKFLQSYLSYRTKDTTVKPKGRQFIPIYDSQKKIIGYRKRTTQAKHSKRSSSKDCNKIPTLDRFPNLGTRTPSTATIMTNGGSSNVSTLSKSLSTGVAVEFTPKKEPQVLDAGDEEIIVPDAAPANEHCIKNETIV